MNEVEEEQKLSNKRLTIRVVEITAVANPEVIGDAEWELRVWANGLERWQTEEPVRLKEGETVPVGGQFHIDISDTTDEVTVEVKAVERDLLRPDDHAEGSAVLYRIQGYGSVSGEIIEIQGRNANLALRLEMEVGS